MNSLRASALPTVMVICVLVSILVLFAITLFDLNILFYSVYHKMKQSKEDVNSAFVLYCNDSTLLASFTESGEYRLYEDKTSSIVRLQMQPWGLYECVTVSTSDDRLHSTRILGKVQDCEYEAALWVCSRDMVLSFAGKTEAEGKAFIPVNGITYIQLGHTLFRGKEIEDDHIDLSERELPPIDSLSVGVFEQLRNSEISSFPPQEAVKPYYSFREETCHFYFPETDHVQIRGNVVLYADEVTLSSESKLSDVILVARKVTLKEKFVGSLQIIARDTVILEDDAQLRYPSGVYLKGNEGRTYLSLGERSVLNGYAVIFGNTENSYGLHIENNYDQNSTAVFSGLLYVDGIADLRGELSGAVYLKECYYLPENGLYAGTIFDAVVRRNNKIAYPFFFRESNYRRKEIKTIH